MPTNHSPPEVKYKINQAIPYIRSITDFYLITQYPSHTDKTVSYLQEYLHVFHETKDMICQENTLQYRELVNEILQEGVHFNFLKVHLISYYIEQIPKFVALAQYSMDISEAIYKGLKDASASRPLN
ncbi:hypothetical protein L211DRAFT_788786 [Terfezia boudieri ATCC MYA-4762]|uniref:Uncharacterized protein n=1 Tax=Terfezia boudieri ATCC MYA-4762 TaxID=1051890 RepID=A0A3N4LKN9_9PEZI|nr:hypothetical protein L211DRAFT_788786 [Terfezia boudieri ATCC MYA-4762]